MSVAELGGTWARAQRLRHVPANAATGPRASLTFRSVSCLADGTCLAVAEYRIRGGGFGATVMTKSGNTWISAIQLRTPPDGATGRKQDASATGIGCTAAGFCAIGGTYRTASLTTRLMAAIN